MKWIIYSCVGILHIESTHQGPKTTTQMMYLKLVNNKLIKNDIFHYLCNYITYFVT